MGNEFSTPYDGPTEVLEGRDIPSIAKFIKSDACRHIFVMDGAGVSTSAGIPDFRSPKTGLYHNLERLNLPTPESVFEINFFRSNPVPFYTLAKELMPGKYRPTPTHAFVNLLYKRGLLRMCYTQNIDTLERLAGLPDQAIVEAHGSFANQHCIECGAHYDHNKLKEQILRSEVAHCDQCGGLVKPDIVFFGESLPDKFHKTIGLLRSADLLIVMGTSLKVHPFATLTQLVPEGCPRVLINMDPAGDIGSRADDVVLLGKTDEITRDLCKELGEDWVKDLDALWAETAKYGPSMEAATAEVAEAAKEKVEEVRKPEAAEEVAKKAAKAAEEEQLAAEVEALAKKIETSLEIGGTPSGATEKTEESAEKKAPAQPIPQQQPEETKPSATEPEKPVEAKVAEVPAPAAPQEAKTEEPKPQEAKTEETKAAEPKSEAPASTEPSTTETAEKPSEQKL